MFPFLKSKTFPRQTFLSIFIYILRSLSTKKLKKEKRISMITNILSTNTYDLIHIHSFSFLSDALQIQKTNNNIRFNKHTD
jgi:hypothetical protein